MSTQKNQHLGFTLIEVVLVVGLLTLLLGSVAAVTLSSNRAFQAAQAATDLEARARRAVERIADEFAAAGLATIAPHPGANVHFSDLTLQRPDLVVAGAIQWADASRIRRIQSPTDPEDGADNDSNGLVDDGRVVLVLSEGQANERTLVLARGVPRFLEGELANGVDDNGNGLVDERGLAFEFWRETPASDDDVLVIRLSLEAIDGEGRLLVRTIETRIRPRN